MASEQVCALHDVAFSYDTALEPLFSGLTVHFPCGFTGVVGANGSGKTTLLQLIAGQLAPTAGIIQGNQGAIYCEQRTDTPPNGLADLLQDWQAETFELRGRLGIEQDCLERWQTLSHGERKRVQIAVALWLKPSLLAIDEPTNHIDSPARDLLIANLKRFSAVGLIVSHDRDLLDELCTQCLWLNPPNTRLFPGNFTQASKQRQHHTDAAVHERKQAVRQHKHLQREIARRREHASREHSIRSKRGLSAKDNDAKEKIDRARVTDSKAGNSLRQLQGKADRSRSRVEDAHVDKEYETGIWLPGSTSARNNLFVLEPGEIALGGDRILKFPALHMQPQDRIAITGANGTGKSTLVEHILQHVNVPGDKLTAMPQELTAVVANRILDEARALSHEQLGHLMNVVSRLGSRPRRLLESRQPSPGEIRKLLLALGMARAPHLIVMDEPTNHLDLPSIEALEKALHHCPCGMLLVSHDQRLLNNLATTRWHLETDEQGHTKVIVR